MLASGPLASSPLAAQSRVDVEVFVAGVSATGAIGNAFVNEVIVTGVSATGSIGEAKPRISVESPPALRGSIGQVLVWSNRRVISGQGFVEITPDPDVIFTPKTPSTPNKYIAVAPSPDAGYTKTVPSTSVSWSKTIV